MAFIKSVVRHLTPTADAIAPTLSRRVCCLCMRVIKPNNQPGDFIGTHQEHDTHGHCDPCHERYMDKICRILPLLLATGYWLLSQ